MSDIFGMKVVALMEFYPASLYGTLGPFTFVHTSEVLLLFVMYIHIKSFIGN
jgi:hypothetical protein